MTLYSVTNRYRLHPVTVRSLPFPAVPGTLRNAPVPCVPYRSPYVVGGGTQGTANRERAGGAADAPKQPDRRRPKP